MTTTANILTTEESVGTTTEEHGQTTTEKSAETTTESAVDTTMQSSTDATTEASVLLSSNVNSNDGNKTCPCECAKGSVTNYTKEEIHEIVVEIKKNLTLDKKTLTLSKIKKISIKDGRPSAKALGAVGIAIFVSFGALIVLFDINFYISLFNTAKVFVGQLIIRK